MIINVPYFFRDDDDDEEEERPNKKLKLELDTILCDCSSKEITVISGHQTRLCIRCVSLEEQF